MGSAYLDLCQLNFHLKVSGLAFQHINAPSLKTLDLVGHCKRYKSKSGLMPYQNQPSERDSSVCLSHLAKT